MACHNVVCPGANASCVAYELSGNNPRRDGCRGRSRHERSDKELDYEPPDLRVPLDRVSSLIDSRAPSRDVEVCWRCACCGRRKGTAVLEHGEGRPATERIQIQCNAAPQQVPRGSFRPVACLAADEPLAEFWRRGCVREMLMRGMPDKDLGEWSRRGINCTTGVKPDEADGHAFSASTVSSTAGVAPTPLGVRGHTYATDFCSSAETVLNSVATVSSSARAAATRSRPRVNPRTDTPSSRASSVSDR
jgi:hypothetical protein